MKNIKETDLSNIKPVAHAIVGNNKSSLSFEFLTKMVTREVEFRGQMIPYQESEVVAPDGDLMLYTEADLERAYNIGRNSVTEKSEAIEPLKWLWLDGEDMDWEKEAFPIIDKYLRLMGEFDEEEPKEEPKEEVSLVNATFIGKDRSMGFRRGKAYLLEVRKRKNGIIEIIDLDKNKYCVYSNQVAFENNWVVVEKG